MGVRSVVLGVGHHLPRQVVTSTDVEERVYGQTQFRIPKGLLERATGVVERRYRSESEQSSDLATKAAEMALERAEVDSSDIDLLIFASCTQDITEPATANIIQEKLGADRSQVFDIKNACNSFLNGLDVAESHIRAGKAKTALVAVGETLSISIDWNIDSAERLRSRISALTLGDAGAAAVVRGDSNGNGRGMLPGAFQTYGDQWRLATVLAGGSMHGIRAEHAFFSGQSHELRGQAIRHVPVLVKKVVENVGWKMDEVDVACCHQVTMDLVEEIADRCGIPVEKCMVSIRDCGNTAAASIGIGLSRAFAEGRLKPGAKVLLVGAAAGFSVGAVPLVW